MDIKWLFILSMGLSVAKTDLNNHQLVSSPGYFAESSICLQTKNSGHAGIRVSYYNTPIEVSDFFQAHTDREKVTLQELTIAPYMGINKKLFDNGRAYFDFGPQWQLYNQIGISSRLSYLHKIKLDKNRSYFIGFKGGLDYWLFDGLDEYKDQTDFQGDIMLNFSISTAFPLD